MNAIQIAGSTCVGHQKREQPEPMGNCFSVKADDGKYYKIANFNLENLEALLEKGLTWPIALKLMGERHALIHDGRIGERWYDREYCEICTPHAFLPAPQVDRRERDVLRGAIQDCGEFTIRRLCVPAEFP